MAKRVGVDKWLFGTVLLLVLFGLVMVFSSSAVMAKETLGSPYAFVKKQLLWAVLGLVALTLLMRVDYRRYNNQRFVMSLLAVTAVLLTVVFFMHGKINGAHRWIAFGPATLQPSELAKPAIVLFLAYFLQRRIHAMEDWRTLLKAAAPGILFAVLILQEPDLGTALVCLGVMALMLYLAGAQFKYFFYGALVASPVLYYKLFHVAFRRARMLAFINPQLDAKGAGFHVMQSLIAVGTGGFFGRGLMEGVQKLGFLPEEQTDFIYAVICEELGLIGALAVVALFVALGYRGLRASVLSTDPFARFLAFGITTGILIQAFFNISVVLSLLPTKGITLPLISSGGTSVFITLASLGVLLNVTREID